MNFANLQIEDLTLKMRKYENEIKILQEKEEELKKKTEHLNNLSRKYDNLIREKEEILREVNIKNGKLDDNLKKRNILEEEIQNREKEKQDIVNDLKKFEKDLKFTKDINENYQSKLEKV
jgi:chromosome segregation ATPase